MNRKIRKLLRDPRLFFRDAFLNRLIKPSRTREALALLGTMKVSRSTRKYAVVTAVYNVEKYLEYYFKTLVRQTLDFENNIYLIMVDDGSTDASATIIKKWQARYPNNVAYISKDNGGQASARNVGLDYLEVNFDEISFVTFIDADDFVDIDYFKNVDNFLNANRALSLKILGCNLVFYRELSSSFSDTHPLKYRFGKGDSVVRIYDMDRHLQLSAATAFFDVDVIDRNRLRFSELVKPTFEDAHFCARYLRFAGDSYAGFLKSARYFYRKRADGSSTLDTAIIDKRIYSDVLKFGCLDLLNDYIQLGVNIPKVVQMLVLYHLCNFFTWNTLINHPERMPALSEAEKFEFLRRLDEIFSHIDNAVILEFDIAGFWFFHKSGVLNCFKTTRPPFDIVYVEAYDSVKDEVQLRYFCGDPELELFTIEGVDASPSHGKTIRHSFLERTFIFERRVWLPLGNASADARLRVSIGNDAREARVSLKGKQHREGVKLSTLRQLPVRKSLSSALPGAWMLMDRDTQADDNAEHLYRYIRRNHPQQPIWFVLRGDSHDWPRLQKEGFNLLPYGSTAHETALRQCDMIISSHADRYVTNYFGDATIDNKRFVFLQHGITKDDLSDWLNGKTIDVLVTSGEAEFASIAANYGAYKFTHKEVVLTGFPRHDALLRKQSNMHAEKQILIAPTWRMNILGRVISGHLREVNPEFTSTAYFRLWQEILTSDRLRSIAREYGYKVIFFPHANMQPYLNEFQVPTYVEMARHSECQIQDLFCRAATMITDYSSVAFEMALLKKPVLYYQFDRDTIFSGGHTTRAGYFDYERDGFGPVCIDAPLLFDALESILENGAKPNQEYLARMERFFAFRDGKNCERVYRAICALYDSASVPHMETLFDHAKSAERAGHWDLAETRWRHILALPEGSLTPAERCHAQAQLVRAFGHRDPRLVMDIQAGIQATTSKRDEHTGKPNISLASMLTDAHVGLTMDGAEFPH